MVPFVCRLLYTAILLLSICVSLSAQYITDANKCYEEKNYDCAFKLYQDAITSKTYKTEDRPAIDYRMGYCLNQLKRYKEAIPFCNR